jgi:S-adenosylmethionine:tRNA ribosyltransferase-isomerase
MLLDRATGGVGHSHFTALPEHLRDGDLLIVNRSRVLPARLLGRLRGGAEAEALYLFSERDPEFRALVRPGRRLKVGGVVRFDETRACRVIAVHEDGSRTLSYEGPGTVLSLLEAIGRLPLPPYIDRPDDARDRDRYQTVFADQPGSIAAPTAGLHFTPELLMALAARGVLVKDVTLHVGPGTFARVDAEDIEDHRVYRERYFVPEETAVAIEEARRREQRVVAVGTTSVRTLESAFANGEVRAGDGETDLVIRPGHVFQTVDALITNFHLPKSSLLFLVSAFAGRESILRAYEAAIAAGYRFYSYGDAMLIQRESRRNP